MLILILSQTNFVKADEASAIPDINITELTNTLTKPLFIKERKEKLIIIKETPVVKVKVTEIVNPEFELSGVIINKNNKIAILHDKKKQEYIIKKENDDYNGWTIKNINNNTIVVVHNNDERIITLVDK